MASSLIKLDDLLSYQLERMNFSEFVFKDELHLVRQLNDLDPLLPGKEKPTKSNVPKLRNTRRTLSTQSAPVPECQQPLIHEQKTKPNQQLKSVPNPRLAVSESLDCVYEDTTTSTQDASYTSAGPSSSGSKDKRLLCTVSASASFEKSGGGASGGESTDDDFNTMKGAGNQAISTRMRTIRTAEGRLSSGGNGDGSVATVAGSTSDLHTRFKTLVLEWIQQLREQTDGFKSVEESKHLRETGNELYRTEDDPLKASDFYTEAIFRAPHDDLSAAMAFANRSAALHDWGLYQQSYDDCTFAVELGYPKELLPLVRYRQANCALKLRKFDLCEQHLHELLHLEMPEGFEEVIHELWREFEVQKSERFEIGIQCNVDDFVEPANTKLYEIVWHDSSNVVTSSRSASLRATTDIAKNTPIFQDEAGVFVSSGHTRICDNCAVTQFVPLPCIYCTNRLAVYCSRKCRDDHTSIHAYECFAHQIELFEEFSLEFSQAFLLQLSFRMLITGLPQVVPHCRKKPTIGKMWAAFNAILTERNDIPYSALLRLESHIDREDPETLVTCAVIAQILAIYLAECTNFFEHLENLIPVQTKLSINDWQLLSAALLLRHICQLRHKHLIHCPSFVLPEDPHVLAPVDESGVWVTLGHVRRGDLHLLMGRVNTIAYAVFPQTLNLCRHSCQDMLYCKFSGRKLTAYSTCDISKGGSINNCFISENYKLSLHQERRKLLRAHGVNCRCEMCIRRYPDEYFHKFHRYRCENPKCMQIFTPSSQLKNCENLRFWKSPYYRLPENQGCDILICSECDEIQKLEWFWAFQAALVDCDVIEERCKLYAAIERSEVQLVDMHECKVALARQCVEQCLWVHRESQTPLDDWEFNKLGSIMRNSLHIVAAQYRAFSLEYVQYMSYFWDVMALSEYKCTDSELIQMLNALEYIPDEFKEIAINYYEDFIAPKFSDEGTYEAIVDTQV